MSFTVITADIHDELDLVVSRSVRLPVGRYGAAGGYVRVLEAGVDGALLLHVMTDAGRQQQTWVRPGQHLGVLGGWVLEGAGGISGVDGRAIAVGSPVPAGVCGDCWEADADCRCSY